MRVIDTATHAHPLGEAARLFLAACHDRATLPVTVVGLCGGRSIVGFLDALIDQLSQAKSVLPPNVHFFMVDERCVPINHPESNYRLLKERFFDQALAEQQVGPGQIHPFQIGQDAKTAALAYSEELAGLDHEGFSIVVLGLGEDGHVAGLFPHHPAISDQDRKFLTFDDSPKPPPQRMTASLPLVCTAQYGFLLAFGTGKLEAFQRVTSEQVSFDECPARLIHSIPQSWTVTDLVAVS